MFTGIVQSVGHIASISTHGGDRQLGIDLGSLEAVAVACGDSIAVNGVCLTAVAFDGNTFIVDVSTETLNLTTLGKLKEGGRVNLELALTPSARLGGHLVSGHVDATGEVVARHQDARSECFSVHVPGALSHYIAAKGSICVEGVSLTVNSIEEDVFSVSIVPHTLSVTTLGACQPGGRVNIEIDVIARYLERLLSRLSPATQSDAISEDFLRNTGFIATGN